ncbi:MAG: hypothetical protein Q7J29_02650, partial [Stagnimonas sp.]|nr:hypothetical protein [Stagnimonas sp.]
APAPAPEPAPVAVAVAPFNCATGAITCIEVVSTSSTNQVNVPVTFGQPFKAGDWKHKEAGLVARDNFNAAVTLQADDISSHRDGSARFAVLSAQVTGLQANERRIISLFKGTNSALPAALPADPAWNLELEAKVYTQQTTLVKFGDRSGHTPGTPFLQGEQITLRLTGPVTENFTLTVNASQAGGGFDTLTKIAEAFMAMINSQSTAYAASKMGEGGGFESLWLTTKNPAAGAFQVQFVYAGQAKFSQTNLSNYLPPQVLVAKPQAELKRQIGLPGNRRLNGGVVQEFTLVEPFRDVTTNAVHPQLTARLHTRLYESGQRIRTDAVVENNWAYNSNPGNITYSMSFKQAGQTVHQEPAFTHFHHARWRKTLWTGTAPKVAIRHHMTYFMASKITWNYDLSVKVPESVLAALGTRLANANTGPMGNAFITPYFPTTGGREDIGPLPRWTALFLVTQDDRAKAAMLANADAAAGIPIHYRDSVTDQPIDLDRHPGVALRYGQSTTADALPAMTNSATPWTVDTAHQGSFAFIPYIVTGDVFHLDEVMFWAALNMAAVNPGYRNYGEGLVFSDQVRGQAWALRSLGEAARALPDNHAMKNYYQKRLDNNLTWYVNRYPLNPNPASVSPLGAIEKNDDPSVTGPWQNDFVNIVISLLAEDGHPQAQTYNNWLSRFTVGRFRNEANGFCLAKAPTPFLNLKDSNGAYTNNWSTLFQMNWPNQQCNSTTPIDPGSYPSSPEGYAANARAMLSAASNSGIAGAAQAYAAWRSMTPAIDSGFTSDPTWAIVPR